MTHDSAVQTIVSLVPEMEKKSAADVLSDYATENDLPPAQLEKLAQVYNTLRTISHIDHAPEEARGDTVPMVDVPTLVIGYSSGLDQEKAAAKPISHSSHDVATVDLSRALRREINAPDVEKAAAQVTAPPGEAEQQMVNVLDAVKSAAVLMDLELDLEEEMSKLACDIFAAAPVSDTNHFQRDISEFESEALHLGPEYAVKEAGEFMEQFAGPHHVKLTRHDYDEPIQKRAYNIEHLMGGKLAELADLLQTYKIVEKAAAGDPVMIAKLNEIAGESPEPQEGFEIPIPEIGGIDPNAPDEEESEEAEEEAEVSSDDLLGAVPAAGTDTAPDGGSTPRERASPTAREPESKPKKSKDSDDSNSEKPKGPSAGSRLAAAVRGAGGAVGSGLRGAASKADSTLQQITGKERQNTAQRSTDLSVEDIKRSMGVRRLIGTDPVLREHEPREVLELYNSIARKSPEIAGDMSSLRLLLREAVSYEGLTLDASKALTEIQRNSGGAEQQDAENAKKRYAVGGANPIPLTRKA